MASKRSKKRPGPSGDPETGVSPLAPVDPLKVPVLDEDGIRAIEALAVASPNVCLAHNALVLAANLRLSRRASLHLGNQARAEAERIRGLWRADRDELAAELADVVEERDRLKAALEIAGEA